MLRLQVRIGNWLTASGVDTKRRGWRLLLLAAALALLVNAAPASAADGLFVPRAPASQTVRPPGYSLNAREAVRVAERNGEVARVLEGPGSGAAHAFLYGDHFWLVRIFRGRTELARVQLDGRTGKVSWADVGRELSWPPLAHGDHSARATRLSWLLVAAAVLFVAPFADPRRWRQILHLDLFAVIALLVPFVLAQGGRVYAATPLIYPPLLYLLGRCVWLALGARGAGGRLTWVTPRTLGIALVVLVVARVLFVAIDGIVNDVGYASLFGADSIQNGYPLYDSSAQSGHLDAYGPIAYLAYVPFELVLPLRNLSHTSVGAAQAAAIAWDLGTIAALYVLGRRLRDHRTGLALAWGFAACPWTLLVMAKGTNDGLVGLLVALVLLVASSPMWRGLLLALAAAAKFGPLVVAGLFARVGGERTRRPFVTFGATLVSVLVLVVLAYLPDGGIREFYDSTLGFQLSRTSPFSIWGLHPAWDAVRPVFTVLVALAAAAALLLPRERSTVRLAAGGAALLIAVQLTAIHWYWFYIPWFLPYLLVALFSRSYAGSVRNSGSSSESAVATNR
jgi:hypothetical protein